MIGATMFFMGRTVYLMRITTIGHQHFQTCRQQFKDRSSSMEVLAGKGVGTAPVELNMGTANQYSIPPVTIILRTR